MKPNDSSTVPIAIKRRAAEAYPEVLALLDNRLHHLLLRVRDDELHEFGRPALTFGISASHLLEANRSQSQTHALVAARRQRADRYAASVPLRNKPNPLSPG